MTSHQIYRKVETEAKQNENHKKRHRDQECGNKIKFNPGYKDEGESEQHNIDFFFRNNKT